MKCGGLATEDAEKLYKNSDVSKAGPLSMNEFVKGVAADQAVGRTMFDKLVDSFTVSQEGN
jgi:hypothetical protein